MVIVLNEVPPCLRSDGLHTTWPPIGPKYRELDQQAQIKFLNTLTVPLKEAYTLRADMMVRFDLEKARQEGFQFSPAASCRRIPAANYRLYEVVNESMPLAPGYVDREIAVFGHPSGLPRPLTATSIVPAFTSPTIPKTEQQLPLPNINLLDPLYALPPKDFKPAAIRSRTDAKLESNGEQERLLKKPKISKDEAPNAVIAAVEDPADAKYKEKYKELKKKVHFIVGEVEQLSGLLSKAKIKIEKLKFERKYLSSIGSLSSSENSGVSEVENSDDEGSTNIRSHKDTTSNGAPIPTSLPSVPTTSQSSNALPTAQKPNTLVTANNSFPAAVSTPITPLAVKPKKKKAPVDPNAPKRPANAFMLFCDMERAHLKKERDQLKEKMPGSEEDAGLGNITKALGIRWKALSEDGKKEYQTLFQEKVNKYNTEMSEYMEKEIRAGRAEATPLALKKDKKKKEKIEKVEGNTSKESTPIKTGKITEDINLNKGVLMNEKSMENKNLNLESKLVTNIINDSHLKEINEQNSDDVLMEDEEENLEDEIDDALLADDDNAILNNLNESSSPTSYSLFHNNGRS
ncbi:hypothetical protein HK099_008335 [Clydaea vesicula]|uniref:HMG box domain-containing protein n=1 Tax=Clydaea vesicula TaxID=447962 RepID=A0AAD5U6A2_9FUNG|nr:hypothetical protein HK099_008335 [Clydaea vesicula]